ncbi:hypothetical protein HDU86_002734 [Geranomyces michiganensis]|nr:hypothetical protein HDU86_002734 [Geranomyces michiganensis]
MDMTPQQNRISRSWKRLAAQSASKKFVRQPAFPFQFHAAYILRAKQGEVTFDWSALPTTILTAVPNPPQSAKKQLQSRRSARARQEKENFETRLFVTEKLAEWAGKSLRVDGPHGGSRGPLPDKSYGSHSAGASFDRSRSQLDLEKLYTFNNCKFTYRGRPPTMPDKDEGMQTETAAPPQEGASAADAKPPDASGSVRFGAADITADTSVLATSEAAGRLDIRQLLDIVQELQREENPESGDYQVRCSGGWRYLRNFSI